MSSAVLDPLRRNRITTRGPLLRLRARDGHRSEHTGEGVGGVEPSHG
jgi:hypothetical protein